ncbi:carbohydrate ABC transporter permease [Actinokineospora auranticolor]|uniref:carbohydrate ABC transporter permease n=1 Tax=Actinokineospora auranticolor TaxID=155976 RepID=UPI0035A92DA2
MFKSPAQRVGLTVFGLLVAGFFLFPVYWMFTTSLKTPAQVLSPAYDLIPLSATLKNFSNAISIPNFTTFLTNSLIVTLGAVAFTLAAGLLAAVPLARMRFRGRKGFLLLVLVAQLAPAEALFIPLYLIMRDADLLNSLLGLGLIYVAFTLPFTAWTLRGFVKGIPIDLEEAAMVDGCGRWGVFRRVTLPLLGPGLVATSVFSFITAWNEFLYALVFLREKDKQTLPVWLSSFRTAFGTDWGATMAASMIYAVPALIFFLLVQRKLVAGTTAGAVKG